MYQIRFKPDHIKINKSKCTAVYETNDVSTNTAANVAANLDLNLKTIKEQFPPKPPSKRLLHDILAGFIADTDPSSFVEAGCVSCGQLTPVKNLKDIKSLKYSLKPLKSHDGLMRVECKTEKDLVTEIEGPVLAHDC